MSLPSIPSKVSPPTREFVVGCAILVAVVASRGFSIAYPAELSADESELLVQIARYEHDLMPWRSVDGSTIGPVNPWFLLLVKQTGWPMNYGGVHLLSALLQALIVLVSYGTVRLFLPFHPAWLVGLAGALALGGSASIDFMYFATELVPALILSLAVFAGLWARQGRPAPLALLAGAAFCCGLAPWAKLQAAPVALALGGFTVWTAWAHLAPGRPRPRRMAAVALVVAAAVLPAGVILTAVGLGGVFPDFWASYIVANLGYAGGFHVTAAGLRLIDLLRDSQLNGLLAGAAALAGFGLVLARRQPAAPENPVPWIRTLAGLYLGAAVYACIRPPHGFGHYHVFLIGPLLVTLGALVHRTWPDRPPPDATWIRRKAGRLVALGVLVPTGVLSVHHYAKEEPLRQDLREKLRRADQSVPAVVTREILRAAPGARTMVVWGWMPTLHVRSGLASASRHTISHFLIDPGASREHIRRQFLQDVRTARPDVIVDAVASDCFTWYWDLPSSRLESFPEFAAYVQADYTLALSIMGDQAGVPLRVFVRKTPGDPRP